MARGERLADVLSNLQCLHTRSGSARAPCTCCNKGKPLIPKPWPWNPEPWCRFQQHLQAWGYKGHKNGEVIDREFFDEHLSGGQNALLGKFLWPDRSTEEQARFGVEKEDLFRELARAVHPVLHLSGIRAFGMDGLRHSGFRGYTLKVHREDDHLGSSKR